MTERDVHDVALPGLDGAPAPTRASETHENPNVASEWPTRPWMRTPKDPVRFNKYLEAVGAASNGGDHVGFSTRVAITHAVMPVIDAEIADENRAVAYYRSQAHLIAEVLDKYPHDVTCYSDRSGTSCTCWRAALLQAIGAES